MGAKIFGGSFIENRNKNVRTERLKKLSNQLFDVSQPDTQREAATELWQALQRSPFGTLATFEHFYAAMALLDLDLVKDIEAREVYLNIISKNPNLRADFLSEFSQKLSSKVEGLKEFEIELQDSVSAASIQAGEATSQEQVNQLINKGKEIRKALIESETFAPDLYKKLLMQGDELKEFSTEELIKLAKMNHGAAMAMFDIGEKLNKDNPLGKKIASEIKVEDIVALLTKESMDEVLKNAYFPVVFCFLLKNCTQQFVEFVKNENNMQRWQEAYKSTLNVLLNVTKPESYRPDVLEKLKRDPDLLILLAKAVDDRSNPVSEPNAAYLACLIIHANKPSDYFRAILKHDQINNKLASIIAKQPKEFVDKLSEELQSKRNNNAISDSTKKDQFENLLSQVIALVVRHNNQNPNETIPTLVNLILTSDEPVKLFNAVVKKDEKGNFSSFVFKNSISFLSQLKRQLISNANNDKQQKQKNLLILQEILQLKLQGWDSVAKALNGNINVSVQDFATSEDVNQLNSPESYNDAIARCHNRLQEIAGILSDEILGRKIKLPEQRAIDFGAAVTKYINAIKPNDQNDQIQDRDKLLFIARTPVLLDKANLNGMEHLSGEDDYLAKTSAYFKAFNQISNNKENFCEYFYQTYAKPYNQQLLNAENQVQQQGLFETAELIKSSPELLAQFKSEQTFWNKIKAFFGFQTHNKLSLDVIKKVLKKGKQKALLHLREEVDVSLPQLNKAGERLDLLMSFVRENVKSTKITDDINQLIENLKKLKKDYESIPMDVQNSDPVLLQTQYLSVEQRYLKIQQAINDLENEIKSKAQSICKGLGTSEEANSLRNLVDETQALLNYANYFNSNNLKAEADSILQTLNEANTILTKPVEEMPWQELYQHHSKCVEAVNIIPKIAGRKAELKSEIVTLSGKKCNQLLREAIPHLQALENVKNQIDQLKGAAVSNDITESADKLLKRLNKLESYIRLESEIIDRENLKNLSEKLDLCENTLRCFHDHLDPINADYIKLQTQQNKELVQSVLDTEIFTQLISELESYKTRAVNFSEIRNEIESFIASLQNISSAFIYKQNNIKSLEIFLDDEFNREKQTVEQQIARAKESKEKIEAKLIQEELKQLKSQFTTQLDALIKDAHLKDRLELLKEDNEVAEELNSVLQASQAVQEELSRDIVFHDLKNLIELQETFEPVFKNKVEKLKQDISILKNQTDAKLKTECAKLKKNKEISTEALNLLTDTINTKKMFFDIVLTPNAKSQAETRSKQALSTLESLEEELKRDHNQMIFKDLVLHLQFCRLFALDQKTVASNYVDEICEMIKKYSPSKNQLFADIPESPISQINGDLFASVDSSVESSPPSPSELFASVDSSSGDLDASNDADRLFADIDSSQKEPSTPKSVQVPSNNGRQQRGTPGTPTRFFITPVNQSQSTQQVQQPDNDLPANSLSN